MIHVSVINNINVVEIIIIIIIQAAVFVDVITIKHDSCSWCCRRNDGD